MSPLNPAHTAARRPMLALAIAAATMTFAAPAAQARPKPVSTTIVCEGHGGGTAGATVTETTQIVYNGKVLQTIKTQYICGNDGKWHTVAKRITPGTGAASQAASSASTKSS